MIAYCGLNCFKCPAYIATQADDNKLRADCAHHWAEEYKLEVRPENIDCDGCKSEGKKFFVCNSCGVRKCATEKGLDNCALCAEYACKKLKKLMSMDPNVAKAIEALRLKTVE